MSPTKKTTKTSANSSNPSKSKKLLAALRRRESKNSAQQSADDEPRLLYSTQREAEAWTRRSRSNFIPGRGCISFAAPVLDHLFSIGWTRKALWKLWYPLLTRRLRGEEVLFLNYAYEEEPPMGIPLSPEDEPNRACIQLYHHVATQAPLRGKNILEVSCGHGGGAAYLTRALQPQRYTALDLNPAGIRFCRQRHQITGLVFMQGDAEHLPFAPGTFDAVVNVEASHCYPNFPRFLVEVSRVLRPGGHFLYADFRFSDGVAQWEQALVAAPLQRLRSQNINAEVLRGMSQNSSRSLDLVERRLPKFLHSLGRDFAGTKGSRIYKALESGELSYRSYCFEKQLSAS